MRGRSLLESLSRRCNVALGTTTRPCAVSRTEGQAARRRWVGLVRHGRRAWSLSHTLRICQTLCTFLGKIPQRVRDLLRVYYMLLLNFCLPKICPNCTKVSGYQSHIKFLMRYFMRRRLSYIFGPCRREPVRFLNLHRQPCVMGQKVRSVPASQCAAAVLWSPGILVWLF